MSRSQPSTSATKSSRTVVPASPATLRAAPIKAASVPPSEAKDHPIPPPAKVKKGPTCHREKPHQPPRKASSKTKEDSAKVPAASSKMGKGHKAKGKSAQGTELPGEGLVSPILQDRTATSTAVATTTCTTTFISAASATVPSIIPSGQPSEAAGDVLLSPSTGVDTSTTGSIAAADTAADTTADTATCPVMCPASATTADICIIPSGPSSEAAGDVPDPAHST
ncbi:hypothetical protein NDU88_004361 [Pleurodeles waltl]|uniref:Uncharacterized protein n=1 Tax=Pleurodeles waltl TaxID=8319 RepID=A0AAV7UGW6_PLEWA|nr:hypothetical protein NDU88_004361 [Pleurodeles waltl]